MSEHYQQLLPCSRCYCCSSSSSLPSCRTNEVADTFRHAGPKTVFFWAPMMKWGLVAAGVNDLKRPAEKLSVSQNLGAFSLPVTSLVSKELVNNHVQPLFSFGSYWYDLGTLLAGHHPHQLLFGCGKLVLPIHCFSTFSHACIAQVNAFVGLTGIVQLYRIWE